MIRKSKNKAPKCKSCGLKMRTCIRPSAPGERFIIGQSKILTTSILETVGVYLCLNPNCPNYGSQNADALPPMLLRLFGYDTHLTRNSSADEAAAEFRRLWIAYFGEGREHGE